MPVRTRWRPLKKLMPPQSKPRERRLCPKVPLSPLLAKTTHRPCITPPDSASGKNNCREISLVCRMGNVTKYI
jgi:hypothetical protein